MNRRLAIAETIDYRLKPLIDRFADRILAEIKTADIEDFVADLKKPRVDRQPGRTLSPASINRVIELMRHMMNWVVGREYLDRTPFRGGTQTLIRKRHEDNQRRRRLSEDEETSLLVAPPFLRSMIHTNEFVVKIGLRFSRAPVRAEGAGGERRDLRGRPRGPTADDSVESATSKRWWGSPSRSSSRHETDGS